MIDRGARCPEYPAGRPLSKRDQVKLVGNSVCPDVARAIVAANVVDAGVLEPQVVEAVA